MFNNTICNQCATWAIQHDKDKRCCKNCLHEKFKRNCNTGNLELYCAQGWEEFDATQDYYTVCCCFLRRSAAYVLRPGCKLITPDGKVIRYKDSFDNE